MIWPVVSNRKIMFKRNNKKFIKIHFWIIFYSVRIMCSWIIIKKPISKKCPFKIKKVNLKRFSEITNLLSTIHLWVSWIKTSKSKSSLKIRLYMLVEVLVLIMRIDFTSVKKKSFSLKLIYWFLKTYSKTLIRPNKYQI